ncbi:MAG: Hcp1 family type secretion system effector [Ramlibacter sp.]|jgi:type VI secretion system secreted protein Hcp|nr:Hcp1 family type secretion system effector [Ramlibacter sp.]
MAIGDMFLKVETARQGVVKGESADKQHSQEIDVLAWSWGMRAQSALSGGGASSKATLDELRITKKVDSASTALMSTMRSNELIKKATLTVRKAGGDPIEYMKITLQDARITQLGVESEEHELVERMSIAFQRINVQYVPQGQDGQVRGSMTFEALIE